MKKIIISIALFVGSFMCFAHNESQMQQQTKPLSVSPNGRIKGLDELAGHIALIEIDGHLYIAYNGRSSQIIHSESCHCKNKKGQK